ncbi:hypothetical protein CMI37_39465 [Candidatus Pacearchaeota archaeon]|nr:hypothetical protein [Candidatus Pacearchaeota archaeon]
MKVGDLVRVRATIENAAQIDNPEQFGIIIDALEQSTGFYVFEVACGHDSGWYCDLDLELVNEST